MLGGIGLAFARALGEFGSLVLIAGTLDTKVSSLYIVELIEGDRPGSAAAISVTLLVISLVSLLLLSFLERWWSRHAR
jgi:sulfate transport system permease protein